MKSRRNLAGENCKIVSVKTIWHKLYTILYLQCRSCNKCKYPLIRPAAHIPNLWIMYVCMHAYAITKIMARCNTIFARCSFKIIPTVFYSHLHQQSASHYLFIYTWPAFLKLYMWRNMCVILQRSRIKLHIATCIIL